MMMDHYSESKLVLSRRMGPRTMALRMNGWMAYRKVLRVPSWTAAGCRKDAMCWARVDSLDWKLVDVCAWKLAIGCVTSLTVSSLVYLSFFSVGTTNDGLDGLEVGRRVSLEVGGFVVPKDGRRVCGAIGGDVGAADFAIPLLTAAG